MNKTELLALIAGDESSRITFQPDNCHADDLACEMSGLLNREGGFILLGVQHDGRVSGLTRSWQEVERRVADIGLNKIQPSLIPTYKTLGLADGKTVGIVEIAPDVRGKPHKAKRGNNWITYVRDGTNTRVASREQEARLYQASKWVRYEVKPVLDTGFDSLDRVRLENYYRHIRKISVPDKTDLDAWQRLLLDSEFLVEDDDEIRASVVGLLLFGSNPNRRLPQAGVTAWAFPGTEKVYSMVDRELIRGPLVPMLSKTGKLTEKGVIDRAVEFVERNAGTTERIEGERRRRQPSFPSEAIRETIVNAVVHRDYTQEGTDIEVSLYADRLEVISPGHLPTGMTVAKMKAGVARRARNELLKEVLRDYGCVRLGDTGVRNKIIDAMREYNGSGPDLDEQDSRFVVRFRKSSESDVQGRKPELRQPDSRF